MTAPVHLPEYTEPDLWADLNAGPPGGPLDALVPKFAAAPAGGFRCPNAGMLLLIVRNDGASSCTVTVPRRPVFSQAPADCVFTVPAGQERIAGPFPPRDFNQGQPREYYQQGAWVDPVNPSKSIGAFLTVQFSQVSGVSYALASVPFATTRAPARDDYATYPFWTLQTPLTDPWLLKVQPLSPMAVTALTYAAPAAGLNVLALPDGYGAWLTPALLDVRNASGAAVTVSIYGLVHELSAGLPLVGQFLRRTATVPAGGRALVRPWRGGIPHCPPPFCEPGESPEWGIQFSSVSGVTVAALDAHAVFWGAGSIAVPPTVPVVQP